MKSKPEIRKKIYELEKVPNYISNTQIAYLKWALKPDFPEWWASHLVNKYTWEIKEDVAIIEILKWILDEEEKIEG